MARVGASLRHVSTLRLADLRQLRHGQPEDLPPAPLPVPAGSLAAEAEKERSTDLVRRKQRNPGTSTVAMGKTKMGNRDAAPCPENRELVSESQI